MLLRSSKRTRPENSTNNADYEAQQKKKRSKSTTTTTTTNKNKKQLQCSLEASTTTTISPPSSPKNIRSLKKPRNPHDEEHDDNVIDNAIISKNNNNATTTKANQDNEADELDSNNNGSTSSSSDSSNTSLVVPPGMISAEDIGNLFECPICFEDMLPPIYQCSRGHLICSSCRTKVCRCPSCREPLVDKVCNLALAQLAERIVNSRCKYWREGCTHKMPYLQKAQHEECCKFRPLCCPMPSSKCCWEGKTADDVVNHLVTKHKLTLRTDETLPSSGICSFKFNLLLNSSNEDPQSVPRSGGHPTMTEKDWCLVRKCKDKSFLVIAERDCYGTLFAYVRVIGTHADSARYSVQASGPNGRKLSWMGVTYGNNDEKGFERKRNDCLRIEGNIVEFFSTQRSQPNLSIPQKMLTVEGAIKIEPKGFPF